ncbi:TetR/AcrR family transcriptional regulator [Denitrobaculum tricleocarpae]|uniref:TetR/AcrR family transcriptional regulator n=1 Tax=Denitrobaculum tricleocarpae TaxID=2591009 RepID=A0A545TG67_9PROT|nr:TetR/AcrR family transcriptional regulator [Denitrobaculum tricleocarpae]TQV76222.1 TetR/AcrR family transcriptional regulator [Denitrobaculum tricleocarpae]
MARRSDHTREEIKTMAVAAGRELIRDAGYAGFSARKVATAIGYTVGTLYNVFENHDDIILHINAVTLEDLLSVMESRFGVSGDASADLDDYEALRALAACYIDYARENYNCWSALFEHNLAPDMPLPDWYGEKIGALFTLIEARLKPVVGEDEAELRQTARVLWASIHGICALTLTNKLTLVGVETAESLTAALIENYIAGLKTRPARL